jgi:2-amino-4-hydroxy-6-hydroxymethyldihydropteridine diphosphokinase
MKGGLAAIKTMNQHPNPAKDHTAYISVGSNLGRRRANCCDGIYLLAETDGCRLSCQAPCYRTAPVGYLEQGWFVNTLIRIETVLSPAALLGRLKAVERKVGRRPGSVRFGPRVLDMDVLLFGNRVIDEPGLSVPHPRMHQRRFVLVPFCDIDPAIVHPTLGETMHTLLQRLDKEEQKVDPYPCDC